ncbi:TetR-like C-terminal domain-containing protein [Nocardia ignorata]|uniref:TetR-like C-terminal domain-containing protein n=1 Tax=Nocardia ignorata TaxID=145285 RepID=UPI003625C5BB
MSDGHYVRQDFGRLKNGSPPGRPDGSAPASSCQAGSGGGRPRWLAPGAAHREYSTEHPGRWASLQRRAGQAAVDSGAARRIVQVTDAVLLGYDIAVPDRVHATRIMGSALSGFLNLERSGNFAHSMPPAEQSWPELIDALDFLLAHWHNRGTARERATP